MLITFCLRVQPNIIFASFVKEGSAKNSDSVTPLNADYVLSKSATEYYCVRLGRLGRIMRAAFVGCGYSLNVADKDNISSLPLLALYKAYFDSYAPLRDVSWSSTYCFRVIDKVFELGIVGLLDSSILSDVWSFFMVEFPNLFATYEDDFLSIHRLSANTQNPSDLTGGQLKQPYGNLSTDVSVDFDDVSSKTLHSPQNSDGAASPITLLSLQTLQRLQRFINKDSIIGKKVSDWLSVHFGAQVATDYFKNAYNIRDIVTRCDINDIFSTADTTGSDGDYLGAYGGKGLGFSDSGFSFHAPTFGFLFVIGAIMPKNGFYQGTDLTLYAKDRFTFPSADFDALGYELTPISVVRDDGGTDISPSASAFGFVPRYSGFKVKKDVVNGDMSRNSTKHQLSAYHLERMLSTPTYSYTKNTDGSVVITPAGAGFTPAASQSWRYVSRYPWLGNYGRIFYNDTDNYTLNSDPYDVDDQFIVQSVFDVKLTNKLKPLSESFDTYEESTDNSSTNVRAE
nr:MAG TPA: Major capsid protein [Microviridae sp.]